jgi:hypothetical protein
VAEYSAAELKSRRQREQPEKSATKIWPDFRKKMAEKGLIFKSLFSFTFSLRMTG